MTALEGDASGRVRAAHLSDGSTVETDVVVVSLGAHPQHRLARRIRTRGGPSRDRVRRRLPGVRHPGNRDRRHLCGGRRRPLPARLCSATSSSSLEHWGNAVAQAGIAAHNMLSESTDRCPHVDAGLLVLAVRSEHQVGRGAVHWETEILISQGSLEERRFVGVYGYQGRVIGAVDLRPVPVDAVLPGADRDHRAVPAAVPHGGPALGAGGSPMAADFPDPSVPTHGPTMTLSGYSPADRRMTLHPRGTDPARPRGLAMTQSPCTRSWTTPTAPTRIRCTRSCGRRRSYHEEDGAVRRQHLLRDPQPPARPADQLRRPQSGLDRPRPAGRVVPGGGERPCRRASCGSTLRNTTGCDG